MDAETLFRELHRTLRSTHRVPMQIRAGGKLVEVESLGLETLPGGRMVVTITAKEPLRVAEPLPEGVVDIRGSRR